MNGRREAMLAEMGIKPVWRVRGEQPVADLPVSMEVAEPAPDGRAMAPVIETVAAMSATAALKVREPAPPPASAPAASASPVASMDWPQLEQAVSECRACRLCERRKQAVLGVGDREADWMFIGEGPGAEEDERGEPFVGQAGRLLDAMLSSVGMARGQDVYIANAVKCRPPGNRTPETDEMAACRPYLDRQIALVKPRLLIAMGRPAAQTLLGEDDLRISASRKRVFQHSSGIPLIVTYHPAYLLRNLTDKAKAWEDLCFAQDEMEKLKT